MSLRIFRTQYSKILPPVSYIYILYHNQFMARNSRLRSRRIYSVDSMHRKKRDRTRERNAGDLYRSVQIPIEINSRTLDCPFRRTTVPDTSTR